jgi:TRAP-type uncharacterized transport system substrate-binding protein
MASWEKRVVLRILAVTLSVAAAVWLALWYFIPAVPSNLTIAVGFRGGAFSHIPDRYREKLQSHKVKLNVRYTNGAAESLSLLQDPNSGVDAALLFAGIGNSATSPNVVSLGRINYAPYWIFYRGAETIERLTQVKGKRIIINGAVRSVIMPLLAIHGVNSDNSAIKTAPGVVATKALVNGEADVVFLPPQELDGPEVQTLLHTPDVRLLSLAQADALVRLFPGISRLVLPKGIIDLEKNIPTVDVNLIGSTNVLVARKALHPELIYLLAQTAQAVHGVSGIFQNSGEFPTQTDSEYPMAEDAVDFYRNGPSLLQRYLPFWMISYAKPVAAILIATFAVVIPLLTYGPKLYEWLLGVYARKLYRRLRAIQTTLLDPELNAAQIIALQADLESVVEAVKQVPLQQSDLFVDLFMHIRLARTELASRVAALSG